MYKTVTVYAYTTALCKVSRVHIEVMQLTSWSDILGYFPSHEWQKSGGFYSDLRNQSSCETCVFSTSTTVVK